MTFVLGSVIADRYQIVGTKRGGMAEVAICRDLRVAEGSNGDALVAIKAVAPEVAADPRARARFEREAEAWMKVGRVGDAGFVLPLREVIAMPGTFMVCMPYCRQGTLGDRMRTGRLSTADVTEYATQLVLGLHYLTVTMGVIHRDLKPSNVLIADNGRLQISDLGLVKVVGDGCDGLNRGGLGLDRDAAGRAETQFGQFLGTYPYAAPEQLLGVQPIDWRADLWAFGVIVYEMYMGRRPYPDDDVAGHLRRILSAPPSGLHNLADHASPAMAAIVARCLAANPQERFSTIRDLIDWWDRAVETSNRPGVRSPTTGLLALRRGGDADAGWTTLLFPDRLPATDTWLQFNNAVQNGVIEARDYYRLDRFEDAIRAAHKTLGQPDDPQSHLGCLFAGELSEAVTFVHPASVPPGTVRSIMVPSAAMARDALRWWMRALVALIESSSTNEKWVAQLHALAARVATADLGDTDLLVLAAQGYMFAADYNTAIVVSNSLLRRDPLDRIAAWVSFQSTRRSGAVHAAEVLGRSMIERFRAQGTPECLNEAARYAYCIQDWAVTVQLGPQALRGTDSDYEVLVMLTSALLMLKRRDDARTYYERMRHIAPNAGPTQQLASVF